METNILAQDASINPVQDSSRPPLTHHPATRQFCIDLARQLAATRCADVVVLDVTGISPITDFMVIATGSSPRQMKTVLDEAQELAASRGFSAFSRADDAGSNWLVIDFVDVVVHVFSADARQYYDLDNLWGDARQVEWSDGAQGAPVLDA